MKEQKKELNWSDELIRSATVQDIFLSPKGIVGCWLPA